MFLLVLVTLGDCFLDGYHFHFGSVQITVIYSVLDSGQHTETCVPVTLAQRSFQIVVYLLSVLVFCLI